MASSKKPADFVEPGGGSDSTAAFNQFQQPYCPVNAPDENLCCPVINVVPRMAGRSMQLQNDQPAAAAYPSQEIMPTVQQLPQQIQGMSHPDPVVESDFLASVPPPEVTYNLTLPEETVNSGTLSDVQLEAVTYACQQHEKFLPDGSRAGYLIGDGAGVGKGREIAGIIFENWKNGRKTAVWISTSNDLITDAKRDLKDIGAVEIPVLPISGMKYDQISPDFQGVIFTTYSNLIAKSSNKDSDYGTRLKMIHQRLGKDFDGLIVFDECHRAKNLVPTGSTKPSKTGEAVLELQT